MPVCYLSIRYHRHNYKQMIIRILELYIRIQPISLLLYKVKILLIRSPKFLSFQNKQKINIKMNKRIRRYSSACILQALKVLIFMKGRAIKQIIIKILWALISTMHNPYRYFLRNHL
jgi:hypothetical protein